MHVLIVTSEWPRYQGDITGIHVVRQIERLRESGVDVSTFDFHGRKNPFFYLKAILDFRRLPLHYYDVIHAHHGQAGIVALSQRKVPVVVTFHGSDLQGIFDKSGQITILGHILRIASRIVAKRADAVIIVSKHMESLLPLRDFHVIPVGIDLELFSEESCIKARQILGFPAQKVLVLFIGDPNRMEKRFWLARESINLLQEQMDVDLIVANGILPEKMPLFLNACNVLLITSKSEGSPTVVKEALACNLPIVSTAVGDVQERIGNVPGCIVCNDDKPETIAAGLLTVLNLGHRNEGRQTVLGLDERWLVQKVIQVYQKAASNAEPK